MSKVDLSTITVRCDRHRKLCIAAGSLVKHSDGSYCDSGRFRIREDRMVNPETAWAELQKLGETRK